MKIKIYKSTQEFIFNLFLPFGIEVKVTEQQAEFAEFNERQINALQYLKTHKRITNEAYQKLNNVSRSAAKRDLAELLSKGKIRKVGTGRSTYYESVK